MLEAEDNLYIIKKVQLFFDVYVEVKWIRNFYLFNGADCDCINYEMRLVAELQYHWRFQFYDFAVTPICKANYR